MEEGARLSGQQVWAGGIHACAPQRLSAREFRRNSALPRICPHSNAGKPERSRTASASADTTDPSFNEARNSSWQGDRCYPTQSTPCRGDAFRKNHVASSTAFSVTV